ncbi:MAG: hypothetical protein N2C14_24665, partial [Planctomycetales bacterium]
AIPGKRLGALLPTATKTDCRAMCVGPRGQVWAAVRGWFGKDGDRLHLVSYQPGDDAPRDRGPLAVRNPKFTAFAGADGKPLPWSHGFRKTADGTLTPRYHMGVCESRSGVVYMTVIYPYTLLEIHLPKD